LQDVAGSVRLGSELCSATHNKHKGKRNSIRNIIIREKMIEVLSIIWDTNRTELVGYMKDGNQRGNEKWETDECLDMEME
jgi:hypothetical protein